MSRPAELSSSMVRKGEAVPFTLQEREPDHERKRHWYAREKVWQAVDCLVGDGKLQDRLVAAAHPLVRLRTLHADEVAQLPDGVRAKFDAVAADLTKRPPEWPRDSAIEASVRKLKPHQRSKLARDILDIFVTLSGGL